VSDGVLSYINPEADSLKVMLAYSDGKKSGKMTVPEMMELKGIPEYLEEEVYPTEKAVNAKFNNAVKFHPPYISGYSNNREQYYQDLEDWKIHCKKEKAKKRIGALNKRGKSGVVKADKKAQVIIDAKQSQR
jgi:hypothetical protein